MKATRTRRRPAALRPILPLLAVFLISCGSDDTAGPPTKPAPKPQVSASFLDCWVQGLEYATATRSGVTSEYGVIACNLGDDIAFFLGGIEFGTGVAGPYMNPIEITQETDMYAFRPTNIACFLQTIDDDGKPSNGIVITEAVRTAAVGMTVNFDQYPGTFASDLDVQRVISDLTSVTAAGTRPLVASSAARVHLGNTMLVVLAGDYRGELEQEDEVVGSWRMTATPTGAITGRANWDTDGSYVNLEGEMQPSGSFSCTGVTALGFNLGGRVNRNSSGLYSVSAGWNDYEQGMGSADGSRLSAYPILTACP